MQVVKGATCWECSIYVTWTRTRCHVYNMIHSQTDNPKKFMQNRSIMSYTVGKYKNNSMLVVTRDICSEYSIYVSWTWTRCHIHNM